MFIFGGQNYDLATNPEIAPRVGAISGQGTSFENYFLIDSQKGHIYNTAAECNAYKV